MGFFEEYVVWYLIGVLFGFLGIFFIYWFGVCFFGFMVGWIVVCFLFLIFVYYGYMFNNFKDILFVVMCMVFLYVFVCVLDELFVLL